MSQNLVRSNRLCEQSATRRAATRASETDDPKPVMGSLSLPTIPTRTPGLSLRCGLHHGSEVRERSAAVPLGAAVGANRSSPFSVEDGQNVERRGPRERFRGGVSQSPPSSTRYPYPWMFLGAAFACDGPERGSRGILFAMERDYGLPDTCPSGSSILWIILFVFRQVF
jgi:hypothetical protein